MINYNDKNELLANREKIEKIEFLDIKKVKEDYISYWKSVISIPQEKIQKMLDWLETTDFYSAPASISNKESPKHIMLVTNFVFNLFSRLRNV